MFGFSNRGTKQYVPVTGCAGLLFVVRLKLLYAIRRRDCRRVLRLSCALGGFPLLTPFGLRSLLFLTLEFLLTLLEGDAHGSPQKYDSILRSFIIAVPTARRPASRE